MYSFSKHTIECPTCKTNNRFKSAYTNVMCCTVCKTVLERMGSNAEIREARVQHWGMPTPGVLQIGTKGKYNNQSFEIIGLVHCDMDRFFINQYHLMIEGSGHKILNEQAGFYSFLEKDVYDDITKMAGLKNLEVGKINAHVYDKTAMFIKNKATCLRSWVQGEILLTDADGKFGYFELMSVYGSHIEIYEFEKNKFELFKVLPVNLESLAISMPEMKEEKAFPVKCDKCNHAFSLKYAAVVKHVVCPSCKVWNEIAVNHTLQEKNLYFKKFEPDIPVGTEFKLFDVSYEVIGVVQKQEVGSNDVVWTEYLLWNSKQAFAFLSVFEGHWIFLQKVVLNKLWPLYVDDIAVEDNTYLLFNDYGYKVVNATGVSLLPLNGTGMKVREYISPPFMYSAEFYSKKELTWYKGEHIPKEDLEQALQHTKIVLPASLGVGALQIPRGFIFPKLLRKISIAAVLLVSLVHAIFLFTADERVLFTENIPINDSSNLKEFVSPSFELTKSSSNLEFRIDAPVDNSWLEANISLVNDKTGKEFTVEKGVEYYSGYSGGERWSEGDREATEMLSSIPAGKYHLNVVTAVGDGSRVNSFLLTVKNDVPMWRNYFIIILLIAIYPAVVWFRMRSYEQKRWYGSDHSPYKSSDE